MMSITPRGLLFVMVGPGGTGKNTLMNDIMQRHPHIKQLATATTRPMRPGERQGREHEFVSEERFHEMIAHDDLLEHQEVTPGRFYGIIRSTVEKHLSTGQHLMADIEVIGAKILREKYPDDTVLIFVTVPGATLSEKLVELQERMLERIEGDATEEDYIRTRQRLERARELEFPFESACDITIVNDEKERAVNELEQFVLSKIAERKAATPEEA
jgi:guanylate kinase